MTKIEPFIATFCFVYRIQTFMGLWMVIESYLKQLQKFRGTALFWNTLMKFNLNLHCPMFGLLTRQMGQGKAQVFTLRRFQRYCRKDTFSLGVQKEIWFMTLLVAAAQPQRRRTNLKEIGFCPKFQKNIAMLRRSGYYLIYLFVLYFLAFNVRFPAVRRIESIGGKARLNAF